VPHNANVSSGVIDWGSNRNTEKALAFKIDCGGASFEHAGRSRRFLCGHTGRVDLAGHDFCGILMKVANARSFGRSDDPTTTAEDCDDSVDLAGNLVANVLKNSDF
jgi:hypothetical protein